MKKLIGGGLVALAIGLTGCTVVAEGEPTAVAPQASDFAIDVTVVSKLCGTSDWCIYLYDVSARWLPPTPLPRGTTTVVYTVSGGNQIQTGDAELSGEYPSDSQTYTNPFRTSVIGPDGTSLVGTATKVTVEK